MKKEFKQKDTSHAALFIYDYAFFLVQASLLSGNYLDYGEINEEPYSENLEFLIRWLDSPTVSPPASVSKIVSEIFSKMRGEEYLPFFSGTFSECGEGILMQCMKNGIPAYHAVREPKQAYIGGKWEYTGETESSLREVGFIELPVSALTSPKYCGSAQAPL